MISKHKKGADNNNANAAMPKTLTRMESISLQLEQGAQ